MKNEVYASLEEVGAQMLCNDFCRFLAENGYVIMKADSESAKEIERRRKMALMEEEARSRNAELLSRLRAWRRLKASALSVPIYVIMNNKAMYSIVQNEPATMSELSALPGMGPATLDKYGAEILQIVTGECPASHTWGLDAGPGPEMGPETWTEISVSGECHDL